MTALIQKIEASLLNLIAAAVASMPALLGGLIILLLTRYIADLVQKIVGQVARRALSSESLQILLTKTAYIAAWIIGVFMASVMAFPGLSLGDIVAALGLSSVAIGFAFQDIFKNFLAGILLLLQQPFRLHDQVVIDKYEGSVEKIDLRFTEVRTYTGERILIPNATVFTSPVQVRTAYGCRRTDLELGLDYKTSLPEAVELLYKTVSRIQGVLSDPDVEIDIMEFGDSSINFMVRYWTLPQKRNVRQTRTQVIIAIKKACDQANMNIPYPIRTLYMYDQESFKENSLASKNGEVKR